MTNLDAEIRAFRREIISLKASMTKYGRNDKPALPNNEEDSSSEGKSNKKSDTWENNAEIQEAITQENDTFDATARRHKAGLDSSSADVVRNARQESAGSLGSR